MARLRGLPFAFGVLILVAVSAHPAVAASAWTVVPSPNPSDQANYLTSVAAIAPTDVWAVGAEYRPIATPGTLTEHWNGSAWTVVASPNFNNGYNELYGVSAVSSTDVWAVGYHNVALYGSEKTMAQHWNGTAWSIVPTVNLGSNANELLAVAAVTSNDAWAVGFGASSSNTVGRPLIQHWDGTAWRLSPSPNIGRGFGVLQGLYAAGPSDVWAVGRHDEDTLIEHWDGSAWTVVPAPNGSKSDSELYAVSGTGPDDVWAVGETDGNRNGTTLVEHWDGNAWTVVPSPRGAKPFTSLNGVVAVGPDDVWAVGYSYDPLLVLYRTFTAHWDGATWTVVPSPNPDHDINGLQGVDGFAGGDVWAAGAEGSDTLVLRTTDA